jgi:polyhydroxybutyrate depolymerase
MPASPRRIRTARACLLVIALMMLPACTVSPPVRFDRHTLSVGGLSRVWYSYRPDNAVEPGPVLVRLHGFHEAATDIPGVSGMLAQANRYGFTIVAPEGVQLSWNAGGCCGPATIDRVDDMGFLAALITELTRTGVAIPQRVYLAGFSNGAFMAYAFACARPELLAGAAVVEGTLTTGCPAHQPLDLLVIHQTADPVVPFAGNPRPVAVLDPAGPFPSVGVALDAWLAADGCGTQTLPPPPPLHRMSRAILSCPGPTITELEVLGGGAHAWPRHRPLVASRDVVRFFRLGPEG